MNEKMKSEQTRKLYYTPGCNQIQTRPKNAMFLSVANSITHELSKSLGGYMLLKWGDIKFDRPLIDMLIKINDYVENVLMKDWPKNPSDFISEAVPIEDPKRRIDIVGLKMDARYEFETDPRIKKDNALTIYIGRKYAKKEV